MSHGISHTEYSAHTYADPMWHLNVSHVTYQCIPCDISMYPMWHLNVYRALSPCDICHSTAFARHRLLCNSTAQCPIWIISHCAHVAYEYCSLRENQLTQTIAVISLICLPMHKWVMSYTLQFCFMWRTCRTHSWTHELMNSWTHKLMNSWTHELMSRIRMKYVPHIIESCLTHECVMSHICKSREVMFQMNVSCLK